MLQPELSPREMRRRWAEEGNVGAILDLIRETPWSMISIQEQLQNLMVACRAAAKADPEGFSREVYSEMVAFSAFLTFRTQRYVGQMVVGRGAMPCTPGPADFPIDAVERLLPRLAEMNKDMAEVFHAQAATARLWALTRAKQAQVGRAAPKLSRRSVSSSEQESVTGGKAAGADVPRDVVV